jgi:hypothetical protein
VAPGDYLGQWKKLPVGEEESAEEKAIREKADEINKEKAERVQASLTMITYLFDAIAESGFSDVTNVDVTDRLNMKIVYENRLLLELGTEADMPYKLELLKVIITEELEPEARGRLSAANAKDKKVLFTPAEDYIRAESGQENEPDPDTDGDTTEEENDTSEADTDENA